MFGESIFHPSSFTLILTSMLLAANWKMNKTGREAVHFLNNCAQALLPSDVPIVLLAPFTALSALQNRFGDTKLPREQLSYGAQNFYFEESGAFTGEVSSDMLLELECSHVIVGHSERRSIFGESDELLSKKVRKALDKKLIPIFCIGETLTEREAGKLESVLTRQVEKGLELVSDADVSNLVVAYEPVWAIGTGVVATPEQAEEAQAFVRGLLNKKFGATAASIPILYGGSVTPANAYSLMSQKNIDGALVGGASLKVDSLLNIHKECVKALKEK
jgi:triosephosphate isomerase (TIM)